MNEVVTEFPPPPPAAGSEMVMYILLAGVFIAFGVMAWLKMKKKST